MLPLSAVSPDRHQFAWVSADKGLIKLRVVQHDQKIDLSSSPNDVPLRMHVVLLWCKINMEARQHKGTIVVIRQTKIEIGCASMMFLNCYFTHHAYLGPKGLFGQCSRMKLGSDCRQVTSSIRDLRFSRILILFSSRAPTVQQQPRKQTGILRSRLLANTSRSA